MTTPRYSTSQRVADYLGLDLSGLQSIQVDRLLLAADAWVDGWTGRTWDDATPITELQTLDGQALYLQRAPVTSIAALAVRSSLVGAAWDTLSASSYELLDPTQGLILLPWGYARWLVRVTYTPGQTVPDDVTLAATILVASWLKGGERTGAGRSGSITARRLGDVEVRYATTAAGASASASSASPEVLALLAPYRQVVLV